MAGLIARLWQRSPADPYDPNLAGIGGARQGTGPAGEDGFPGSTSQTRTFKGAGPRAVGLRSDSVVGFDQGFEGVQVRMGGRPYSEGWDNPRETVPVVTPQPRTIGFLRRNPGEWFGGQPIVGREVTPVNHIVGTNPSQAAQDAGGHSTWDTETPRTSRQPDIATGAEIKEIPTDPDAFRWKAAPGITWGYNSAPRPDQNRRVEGTEAGAQWAFTTPVSVPTRFKWGGPGGGNQTWSVLRQMPYYGRGDGARGAHLNGTRYYAEGPPVAVNAGQGAYGIRRLRSGGPRRPVSFTEPAPWTSQYYDTTASVGTPDNPGAASQAPQAIYTSPDPGRGGINATGRQ